LHRAYTPGESTSPGGGNTYSDAGYTPSRSTEAIGPAAAVVWGQHWRARKIGLGCHLQGGTEGFRVF